MSRDSRITSFISKIRASLEKKMTHSPRYEEFKVDRVQEAFDDEVGCKSKEYYSSSANIDGPESAMERFRNRVVEAHLRNSESSWTSTVRPRTAEFEDKYSKKLVVALNEGTMQAAITDFRKDISIYNANDSAKIVKTILAKINNYYGVAIATQVAGELTKSGMLIKQKERELV